MFHFNDEETTLFVQQGRTAKAFDLNAIGPSETHLKENSVNSAVLMMIRENGFLRINKTLTVRRGVRFAELSYDVRGVNGQTTINWVRFILNLRRGKIVTSEEMMSLFDYHAMVTGQIIFEETYPKTIYTQEDPSSVEFLYSTNNATFVRIKLFVGLTDVSGVKYEEILEMLDDLPEDPLGIVGNGRIVTSSYLEIIERYNIAFIVCRDPEIFSKFAENQRFRTVYDTGYLAVFQVVT